LVTPDRSSTTRRVLVVDDDVDIRETLTLVLEDEGYAVASASNGEEALAWLRANVRPNVILLDLMMPVMDGQEFRAEQRNDPELAQIPVIVITASGNAKDRVRSMGVAGMIQKPLALDTLLTTVARVG
jgi:CheY-like chemotaxis protein